MQRSLAIVSWILVGAIASGLSIGFFLHKSNADRTHLLQQLMDAQKETARIKMESAQAIREASSTTAAALAKVDAYNKQTQAYEELLKQTILPAKPDARTVQSWSTAYSIPLGVSLRVPPDNAILPNNEHARLQIANANGLNWLYLEAFDPSTVEQPIFSNPETVAFLVDGQLLFGTKGVNIHEPYPFGYRLRPATNPSFVITLFAAPGMSERRLQEILSTITLRS